LRGELRRVNLMKNNEKQALLDLLDRFIEERTCSRDCDKCYYNSYSPTLDIDGFCPLLTAFEMIWYNTNDADTWKKRVGEYNEMG